MIDKIIDEWSYRTNKGYPDINSKEDMDIFESLFGFRLDGKKSLNEEEESENDGISVETLKKLIDANADNKKLLTRVYRTLKASEPIVELKRRLEEVGISKDTFDSRNIQAELINILQKGERSDVGEFIETINTKSIPESGNLRNELSSISSKKVDMISNITGAKNSVTMGKGEIIFPIVYNDVKLKKDGKGDFEVNGKTGELKALGARLSGFRGGARYKPYNEDAPNSWNKGINADVELSRKSGTLNKVVENINDYISRNYNNATVRVTEDTVDDAVKVMAKAAVQHYINTNSIETYILFNERTTNFRSFNPANKILDAIDADEISYSAKPNPQLKDFKL